MSDGSVVEDGYGDVALGSGILGLMIELGCEVGKRERKTGAGT